MAVLKFYNIQALPIEAKGPMIGRDGYKKIFDALKIQVNKEIKYKRLEGISFSLVNDHSIAPIKVKTQDDIAYGEFLKFDNVTTVTSTLGDEEKYVSKGGDSSKKYHFQFAFDFESHILAIEASKGLPATSVLIKALESFLTPFQERLFKKHTLEIIELTDANALNDLFENAASYKKLDVQVTFSNSDDLNELLDNDLSAQQEQEMREKGINKIHHMETSAAKSVMKELSDVGSAYLKLACKFGNASVTYVDNIGQKLTYRMVHTPIKEKVDKTFKNQQGIIENKSERDYALDLKIAIARASTRSILADLTYKKIRNEENEA